MAQADDCTISSFTVADCVALSGCAGGAAALNPWTPEDAPPPGLEGGHGPADRGVHPVRARRQSSIQMGSLLLAADNCGGSTPERALAMDGRSSKVLRGTKQLPLPTSKQQRVAQIQEQYQHVSVLLDQFSTGLPDAH